MPSIRIQRFAGLLPEVNAKLLREDHAQIAHNTLLWDGWLRPMPQFNPIIFGTPFLSLFPSPANNFGILGDATLVDAVQSPQEPFPTDAIVGVYNADIFYRPSPSSTVRRLGMPNPTLTAISQVITNQNKSVYPIPRTYALTYMTSGMEGPPTVFDSLGGSGNLFEGDVVTLGFTLNGGEITNYGITGLRLYRTIPGFDTGEQVSNPTKTEFHLVHEFSFIPSSLNIIYVDSVDATQIPGDLMLTQQFLRHQLPKVDFVRNTESGWLVAGGYDNSFGGAASGQIQVSERFQWHAWPLQNMVYIPDKLIDTAVFYDDVFIGTGNRPYHMRIEFAEDISNDSLKFTIRPFPDNYACVPNSMVTANSGAMYASKDGLVSLEVNDDSIVSKKVTNPGDQLLNPVAAIKIDSVLKAAWWNGFYVGFCSNNIAYLFNVENTHNNEFPLGQLITLDTPAGTPGTNISVGTGLYAMWGNTLYTWPLPGYGYESATKLIYTWKSKKFVLPGLTTMAAAKVVSPFDGAVTFNLYGDGNLLYSAAITSSEPFRLPHQHKCIEWEILLVGTATIQEVHISTSMRELVEEQGHD
jgi:hypothetical protein